MDPLSDVLRAVRLNGAFFYAVEATEPWSVRALPAKELQPRLLPDSEHLISYHVLTSGHCWGGIRGEEQVEMLPGDVLIFPHGDAHLMSYRPGFDADEVLDATPTRYPNIVRLGDGEPAATIVCGFLGCDERPFNPLLATLPRRMHVRGLGQGWIALFSTQVVNESRTDRAGADLVLTRLAELMFIEVLRRYLADLPPGQSGWLAGLRDEVVGQALRLLHARPADPWTLEDLARESNSSRTNLAKRFTELVGQPPMQYLAQWRMQLAAGRLATGNAKLAAIAEEVGYDSEAAFSRAFKRLMGVSPAAWRRARDRSQGNGVAGEL